MGRPSILPCKWMFTCSGLRIVSRLFVMALIALFALSLLGCSKEIAEASEQDRVVGSIASSSTIGPTRTPFLPPTRGPNEPILSPTPDPPRTFSPTRSVPERYQVQYGDMLSAIANRYGVSVEEIVIANGLISPDYLFVGQILEIPAPSPGMPGPDFKIIPDSELVFGPASVYFELDEFLAGHQSYLLEYKQEAEGVMMNGAQIVHKVSVDYSVNPRILLAVLQYQSQWITESNPDPDTLYYPIGHYDPWREGLYAQLAWTANSLNRGYYLWKVSGLSSVVLKDGTSISLDRTINAGTAAIQYLFSLLHGREGWDLAVSEYGFYAYYYFLFGYPFDYSLDPLVPEDLRQPEFQLPFEPDRPWMFTGGPHGAWDDGSAWAALDFAPPGQAMGCVPSNEWIVAIADGLIVRSENGVVIQDLDDDGYEQTGWTIMYMHVGSRNRVEVGTYLDAGERIGNPSCEGGIASGTHVHIARRYNGEWIPADGDLPFVMDNWVTYGLGTVFEGQLIRDDDIVTACECRSPENTIQR